MLDALHQLLLQLLRLHAQKTSIYALAHANLMKIYALGLAPQLTLTYAFAMNQQSTCHSNPSLLNYQGFQLIQTALLLHCQRFALDATIKLAIALKVRK